MNLQEFASKNSMALFYATAGLLLVLMVIGAFALGHGRDGRFGRGEHHRHRNFVPRMEERANVPQRTQTGSPAPTVTTQSALIDESVPDYGAPAPVQ